VALESPPPPQPHRPVRFEVHMHPMQISAAWAAYFNVVRAPERCLLFERDSHIASLQIGASIAKRIE
jgi:hypothetical protein